MEKATIIIPARYGSTRLHGKPLLMIAGTSLIEHVWKAARQTDLRVIVATDNRRIVNCVEAFGGEVVMTGQCQNGTERCAEVVREFGLEGPIVNWQGDSPLIPTDWVFALLAALEEGAAIATPVQQCNEAQARELKMEYATGMPGGTCAVFNQSFRALYFSKAPVPSRGPFWLHVGLYAYTAPALRSYGHDSQPLERAERLEQLRFVEAGWPVQCVPVEGKPIWEVNNLSDVRIVERMLCGDDAALR